MNDLWYLALVFWIQTLLLAAGLLGMSHTVLGSTRSATSASTSASSSSQHLDYSRAELLKEIASTFTNKMKYGHTNDILFVAPEAVTARDELLEALHQVVVSGSVAGLKGEWASHKTHTVYGDSAFLGEAGASAKGADIFEAEMQQSQALDQVRWRGSRPIRWGIWGRGGGCSQSEASTRATSSTFSSNARCRSDDLFRKSHHSPLEHDL